MSEPHDADRLKALEAKIAALKQPAEVKHHSEEHYSQAQLAWRMVIELVAGLGIGFGIGYGIDTLLGTTPIFLVLFIFLSMTKLMILGVNKRFLLMIWKPMTILVDLSPLIITIFLLVQMEMVVMLI